MPPSPSPVRSATPDGSPRMPVPDRSRTDRRPSSRPLAGVALAAALAAGVPASVAGQSGVAGPPAADRATVALAFENDTFASADRHYTSGLRLGVAAPSASTPAALVAAAAASGLFPENARYRLVFTLGQSMFTPRDIRLERPGPRDRSWAGWLYASVGLAGSDGTRSHSLELTLGTVGPSARAGETQRGVHALFGQDEPEGWEHQVGDRPTLGLAYERRWRAREGRTEAFGGLELGLQPHLGATLGNAFAHAHVGATVRAGRRLGQDFGPPRVAPAVPGSGAIGAREGAWYGFAGVDLRLVGRDLFVEERGAGDPPPLEPERLVADLQFGALASLGGTKLAYTHVLRTDQWAGQRGDTSFGAVSLSRAW